MQRVLLISALFVALGVLAAGIVYAATPFAVAGFDCGSVLRPEDPRTDGSARRVTMVQVVAHTACEDERDDRKAVGATLWVAGAAGAVLVCAVPSVARRGRLELQRRRRLRAAHR
jgi:hypothetical protein